MIPSSQTFLILVTIKSKNVILCLLDIKHQILFFKKVKHPDVSKHIQSPQDEPSSCAWSCSVILRQSGLLGTNMDLIYSLSISYMILIPTEAGLVECFSLALNSRDNVH